MKNVRKLVERMNNGDVWYGSVGIIPSSNGAIWTAEVFDETKMSRIVRVNCNDFDQALAELDRACAVYMEVNQ